MEEKINPTLIEARFIGQWLLDKQSICPKIQNKTYSDAFKWEHDCFVGRPLEGWENFIAGKELPFIKLKIEEQFKMGLIAGING